MLFVVHLLRSITKQRTQTKSVDRSMAAHLIWKTLKTIDDFYRLCSGNIKSALVGSCSLERTLSTLDQALVISLCSCFYLGGRLYRPPPKKWLIVSHLSSLSSRLQVALYPKERSVALAVVMAEVVVTQGHPLLMSWWKRKILLQYLSLLFIGAGTVD